VKEKHIQRVLFKQFDNKYLTTEGRKAFENCLNKLKENNNDILLTIQKIKPQYIEYTKKIDNINTIWSQCPMYALFEVIEGITSLEDWETYGKRLSAAELKKQLILICNQWYNIKKKDRCTNNTIANN